MTYNVFGGTLNLTQSVLLITERWQCCYRSGSVYILCEMLIVEAVSD